MIDLLSAARFLGLRTAARPTLSEVDCLELIRRGIPVQTLERLAAAVAPRDASFKYRIVPKANLVRARAAKRLTAAQGVLVARVASVWLQAARIWKSEQATRDFLFRPDPLLGGRNPMDLVLRNEIGAELVRGILGHLEHGSAG
jgi:putative toxin-antitoxin system antitoxin component (TIGR02293 family)